MRLVFSFPHDWPVEVTRDGVRAIVPGHHDTADLWIDVTAVRPLSPYGIASTLTEAMTAALPANAELRLAGPFGFGVSVAGWSLLHGRASVLRHDGRLVEQRVGAAYELPDLVATIVVIGTDEQRWNKHLPGLIALMAAGALDWGNEPACLAEVLGLENVAGWA